MATAVALPMALSNAFARDPIGLLRKWRSVWEGASSGTLRLSPTRRRELSSSVIQRAPWEADSARSTSAAISAWVWAGRVMSSSVKLATASRVRMRSRVSAPRRAFSIAIAAWRANSAVPEAASSTGVPAWIEPSAPTMVSAYQRGTRDQALAPRAPLRGARGV